MAVDGGGSPHDLVVQSWIMYSIGILLYLLRLYARYDRLGLKWQAEDVLMVLAIGWYTALVVTNIQLAEGGGGTLYPPEEFSTFTPEDIAARSQFAKVEFASEQCMVNTIWFLKACMLIIYYRMTANLDWQFWVKLCAAYTAAGYVAVELTLFLNCRPFSGYWTLPPPQQQCATYFNYEVVQAVFNISSDLAILLVIIPRLWKMNMSNREKIPVLVIFGLGFFLIICAIVSKVFTFRDIYDTSYQFWYLREASVGIYVSNLPYVWSFLRRTIGFLHSTATGSKKSSQQLYYGGKTSGHPFSGHTGGRSRNFSAISSNHDEAHLGRSESEEHIFDSSIATETRVLGGDVHLDEVDPSKQYNIQKTTEIHIASSQGKV
ncbi:conserved hypothetical protein [Talaromyces stipitatus ATCC 10500]|uniref:Rhodopsin domain-containing protein n=1 Tax=Talaromyces stipitatus (strain ATCC 10500 / CBS 375.48 / QM 6759 / NRRL 1006) TaxID=441959 RepID=B8MS74_TALSN|nr:uncharacterized protein TSTA_002000 [Talaromyces stipitatus ATCC 10500]XP_002487787.1 uncharacterized protein TSTA_002000 [Talaromyces stipitatus ATCC 10500]EED12132.1 conserved hypothetical protein [Talaromyces stipitatus ATCC 10500]EED12133.1 conserved hypothetical protein [Talaromyces stipitatus ATCC 10500]